MKESNIWFVVLTYQPKIEDLMVHLCALEGLPYVRIQADELVTSHRNIISLAFGEIEQFLRIFFGGFFSGKGFLDGWIGFRAHVMFAASIIFAYGVAGWKKLIGDV